MRERYVSQCRWIVAQRFKYYALSEPSVSDEHFDKAMKVLEEMERKNPELRNGYSPTQYPEEPPCGWVRWLSWDKQRLADIMFGVEN